MNGSYWRMGGTRSNGRLSSSSTDQLTLTTIPSPLTLIIPIIRTTKNRGIGLKKLLRWFKVLWTGSRDGG